MPSLYDISIPVFRLALVNLDHQFGKAEAWLAEQGLDESVLLEARLIEDMHALAAQVQRASDTAKGVGVRVGGLEPVAMTDDEATITDLRARIAKTIAVLDATRASALDDKEAATVVLKLPNRELTFTGASYVLEFALPNFFFHVTTAYALLRMKGVPVGKTDFLWPQGA